MGISTYHQEQQGDQANQDYQHRQDGVLQQITTGKLMVFKHIRSEFDEEATVTVMVKR